MFPLVASNWLLQSAALWLQSLLNSGHVLRLFQNFVPINPGTTLGTFIESTFVGYEPWLLTGNVPSPIKQQDGQYQISFTSPLFACEGGSAQICYGAYIDDGVNVKFSQLFSTPLNVYSGFSFVVPVVISDWSTSVLC